MSKAKMWTRYSGDTLRDPKLASLSRSDRLLHMEALAWANDQQTDGFIARAVLGSMTDLTRPAHAVARLVRTGAWQECDGGWTIVGFHDEQLSTDEVLKRSEVSRQTSERRRRHMAGDHSKCDPERCRELLRVTRHDTPFETKRHGTKRNVAKRSESGGEVKEKDAPPAFDADPRWRAPGAPASSASVREALDVGEAASDVGEAASDVEEVEVEKARALLAKLWALPEPAEERTLPDPIPEDQAHQPEMLELARIYLGEMIEHPWQNPDHQRHEADRALRLAGDQFQRAQMERIGGMLICRPITRRNTTTSEKRRAAEGEPSFAELLRRPRVPGYEDFVRVELTPDWDDANHEGELSADEREELRELTLQVFRALPPWNKAVDPLWTPGALWPADCQRNTHRQAAVDAALEKAVRSTLVHRELSADGWYELHKAAVESAKEAQRYRDKVAADAYPEEEETTESVH